VAVYAIMRWKVVVDASVDGGYTDTLLMALGMLSLLIGSFSMVLSRYYKRMLAYSSIEHTGLICIGLALGPLGVFAALLHLVNHTIAKSLMFFLVGAIEQRYSSTQIADVRGLLKVMPWTGGLFAVGMLAMIGLPPFGLFISEFALFRAGFVGNHPWLMGATLTLLAVAFIALINHLNAMLYGPPPEGVALGEGSGWRIAPLLLSVALLVMLGLTLPAPLATLLAQIVAIVART
jgi:hydrogenase-4 component F